MNNNKPKLQMYPDGNHIMNVHLDGLMGFENGAKWENIPKFSIITGKNGSGKSSLLRHIYRNVADANKEYMIHWYVSNIPNIQNDIKDDIPRKEFIEIIKLMDEGKNDIKFYDKYKREGYYDKIQKSLESDYPSDAFKMIPHNYSGADLFYNLCVKPHRDIKEIIGRWDYSVIQKLNDEFNIDTKQERDNHETQLREKYREKIIDPLIKKINDDLNNLGFKYDFVIDNGNNGNERILFGEDKIEFSSLSDGEKIIINFYGYLWNRIENAPRKKINIMLLDEPDSHLDPDNCKILFDALKNLSDKYGMQIFMTTHRIDTIIHSENNEVFEITNDSLKNDKELALKRMTINNHEIRRVLNPSYTICDIIYVLTEAPDDAKFYQVIYEKLNVERQNKLPLIFIPVGNYVNGNYEGGGCNNVKKYINKIIYDYSECNILPNGVINNPNKIKTENHKVKIYRGIIDRDDKNVQKEGCHVNNDIYCLENYLCFPVNLSYVIKNSDGVLISESMSKESLQSICDVVKSELESKLESKLKNKLCEKKIGNKTYTKEKLEKCLKTLLRGIREEVTTDVTLKSGDVVKIPKILCNAVGEGKGKGHHILDMMIEILGIKNDDLWGVIYSIPNDKLPRRLIEIIDDCWNEK
jgi:energy-coupling factor transporter ATP-binding protein EcfA2